MNVQTTTASVTELESDAIVAGIFLRWNSPFPPWPTWMRPSTG